MTLLPYRMKAKAEEIWASGGVPSIPENHLWGPATWQAPRAPGCRWNAAVWGVVPKFAGPVLDRLLGVHHGAVREPKVFRCQNSPRFRDLIPSNWGCQVHIELWRCACDSEGHGDMAMDSFSLFLRPRKCVFFSLVLRDLAEQTPKTLNT